MSKKIKCIVWDLDNTLWNGILAEGDALLPRADVIQIIKTFDERGILQSIASKNDYKLAKAQLESLGLWNYFLAPEINWGAKSTSVSNIAKQLNLSLDTFAFIDDQSFEREEVSFKHPAVRTYDAARLSEIVSNKDFVPEFVTEDSKLRRHMYQLDRLRDAEKERFDGPDEAFLSQLNLSFKVSKATASDLSRVEELIQRTSQLNTSGIVYSREALIRFIDSDQDELLVAQLDDRFGTYGKIGLCLVRKEASRWEIPLLIMSCRVVSRGVGTVMLNYLRQQAQAANMPLFAKFIPTDRNRMFYFTYKLNGFVDVDNHYLKDTGKGIQFETKYVQFSAPDTLFMRSYDHVS